MPGKKRGAKGWREVPRFDLLYHQTATDRFHQSRLREGIIKLFHSTDGHHRVVQLTPSWSPGGASNHGKWVLEVHIAQGWRSGFTTIVPDVVVIARPSHSLNAL